MTKEKVCETQKKFNRFGECNLSVGGRKIKKVKCKFFFVWELHALFRRGVFLFFSDVNRPRKGVDRCHQSAVCRGIFEATLEPPPPQMGVRSPLQEPDLLMRSVKRS